MSDSPKELPVIVNPLGFLQAEGLRHQPERWSTVSQDDVLGYICEYVNPDAANLVRRYLELTSELPRIRAAPAAREIRDKMFVPLHSAIACYMTGNYYGTIALSGLVCEMLAIFIFEIHDIRAGNEALHSDADKQQRLLGRSFELLGQQRRVDVLHAFGVIRDEHKKRFDKVRELRRRHLHLLSHATSNLQQDAKQSFRYALELTEVVFRAEFKDGAMGMRPQILKYLERKASNPPDQGKPKKSKRRRRRP